MERIMAEMDAVLGLMMMRYGSHYEFSQQDQLTIKEQLIKLDVPTEKEQPSKKDDNNNEGQNIIEKKYSAKRRLEETIVQEPKKICLPDQIEGSRPPSEVPSEFLELDISSDETESEVACSLPVSEHNQNKSTRIHADKKGKNLSLQQILNIPTHAPTDSGHSSSDEHNLLPPTLAPYFFGNLREGLQTEAVTILDRICRASEYEKHHYVETQTALHPLNEPYNPKKARKHSVEQSAVRIKNNRASRESRLKKKAANQKISYSVDFERNLKQNLSLQEQWITCIIAHLEDKLIQQGVEEEDIKKLRTKLGFQ